MLSSINSLALFPRLKIGVLLTTGICLLSDLLTARCSTVHENPDKEQHLMDLRLCRVTLSASEAREGKLGEVR